MIMYRIHFPATLVASVWRSSESWNLQRFCLANIRKRFRHIPHSYSITYVARGQVCWHRSAVRFTPLHLATPPPASAPRFFHYFPLFTSVVVASFSNVCLSFWPGQITFNDLARAKSLLANIWPLARPILTSALVKGAGGAIIYLISFYVRQTLAKSSTQICNFYAHESCKKIFIWKLLHMKHDARSRKLYFV